MMSAFNISFISSLTIDNVLLPTMTLYLMLTAVGIFGNFSIIIATLKNRRLQRNCNIFIAMCAAGEIVHQAAHIPLAYSVFSGKMFTTLEHCLIIQLIPNLSMNFSMFLMFAIGVDRLLSICNPFRYKQMNRVAYVTTMTTAAIFYASTLLVITVHSGIEDRNNDVICIIAAVYTGAAKYIWAAAGCTLNLTIIVMYVVVWIIVKRKPGAHANGNAEQHISGGGQWRKLFRSITIAALLVVFGWFATMSAYAVSLATHRTPLQLHCMTILAGIFVNSSIACNYFVFFTFSPEYRRAFLEHLNYLCGCIHFEVVATRLNLSTRSTDRKQKKPTITGRRKTHHIHSEALLEERIGTSQNERRIAVRRSLSND